MEARREVEWILVDIVKEDVETPDFQKYMHTLQSLLGPISDIAQAPHVRSWFFNYGFGDCQRVKSRIY